MSQYFGGIEAGGTKFVCGIGQGDGKIIHQISIPTGKPESTIFRVTDFFLEKSKDYNLKAVTLGCFGPLDMRKDSLEYGMIKDTNKREWANYPVLKEISQQNKIASFSRNRRKYCCPGGISLGNRKGNK